MWHIAPHPLVPENHDCKHDNHSFAIKLHFNFAHIVKWTVIMLVVTVVSASIGLWRGRSGSPLHSLVRVEAQSVYALSVDGDTLYFARHDQPARHLGRHADGRDTLLVDWRYSCFRDSALAIRTIKGLCVDEFARIMAPSSPVDDTIQGQELATMLQTALKAKQSEAERLQHQVNELEYYARTHSAVDDGYNQVMTFYDSHRRRLATARRTAGIIERAIRNPGRALKKVSFRVNGKPVSVDYQRGMLVYLHPSTPQVPIPVADAPFLWDAMRPWQQPTAFWAVDSMGDRYRLSPSDTLWHGQQFATNGSYYVGTFNRHLQPHGIGLHIDGKMVKYGSWAKGRFMGETMLYTPQRIYGIDISRYQHELHKPVRQQVRIKNRRGRWVTKYRLSSHVDIDWKRLRITHLGGKAQHHVQGEVDYPVSFIFIKSTQGTTIRNKYYPTDLSVALRTGIPVAPYHFFSTLRTGKAQADFFIRHARLSQTTMPPMLDVEPSETEIRKMGGEAVLHREVLAWLQRVEKASGRRPILYVSQTFIDRHLRNAPAELLSYDVWIARYSEYRPYVKLLFWQLSPYGRVKGIHGDVDINVFNGNNEEFTKWLGKP